MSLLDRWFPRLQHYREIGRAALDAEKAQGTPVQRQRDEVEFLPAALEVLETPVSPVGRSLMWALMLLFAIALVWSTIGKLDVVAVAEGKVVPNGKSKTIQPLEAGIVKAILVDNGQHVTQDQALIELDPTEAAADVGKSRTARVDAMLTINRAQALLDAQTGNRAPTVPAVPDATPDRQRDTQRFAESAFYEHRSKVTGLRSQLQKRLQELQTTQHKISSLQQTLPMTRAEEDDYQTLLQQSYVPRHAYLEKVQARIQQEQELAGQQSYAKELQATIQEQRDDIDTAIAQFRREQLDALNQAQQQLTQDQGDETKSRQRQSQTHLTAPVAGTVQELAVHTVGGVVTPAQALLVIVPDDAGLEIEAQILNRDIGFVRPGQDAEIKLDAFPYTHYGTIAGKVMSISQDAVKDDKLGLVYPVRIQLGAHLIVADGKSIQLEPGMSSSVEIKTEQRRIIEYLLTPLLKYQSEALRER
ncbi:HlyD family type I secretion periplasmic adaptor subunit [Pseudomonas sp. 681]|uniref:Membrane fusion protein (MFP) family protein n=1 Tax=Pseudomonas fungipugnans TaxID=3024217 RepID=A0ABT6QIA6_9PSED|nr:HlyD family type I secretion periplasmic adaptor subunit [Pseudomonas sp. 681]MDI2590618.1 HlyD family type I secretion periplasmic adaptor subunit [Pseudomonas sp. 681]